MAPLCVCVLVVWRGEEALYASNRGKQAHAFHAIGVSCQVWEVPTEKTTTAKSQRRRPRTSVPSAPGPAFPQLQAVPWGLLSPLIWGEGGPKNSEPL